MLVTTAERLHGAVGAQDICARYTTIAQRVANNFAVPINYRNDTILSVTASIGIAIGSPDYASVHR